MRPELSGGALRIAPQDYWKPETGFANAFKAIFGMVGSVRTGLREQETEEPIPEQPGLRISTAVKEAERYAVIASYSFDTRTLFVSRDATANGAKNQLGPPPAIVVPCAAKTQRRLTEQAYKMHLEHINFLNAVSTGDEPAITQRIAADAIWVWKQLLSASDFQLPAPASCTNGDGGVSCSWDTGRYHLDLDIAPGEPATFFFCDRLTDKYWQECYRVGSPLPMLVVAKLPLFA